MAIDIPKFQHSPIASTHTNGCECFNDLPSTAAQASNVHFIDDEMREGGTILKALNHGNGCCCKGQPRTRMARSIHFAATCQALNDGLTLKYYNQLQNTPLIGEQDDVSREFQMNHQKAPSYPTT